MKRIVAICVRCRAGYRCHRKGASCDRVEGTAFCEGRIRRLAVPVPVDEFMLMQDEDRQELKLAASVGSVVC